ncbi:MAG TPA: hypothetical protein VGM82_19740 [Gemmatimonadaceae bacterium]|jgi:hypothetical protein
MLRPPARLFGPRFFAFFALLAMFAQSVVAVAPLAEGRTARMSSHVESHGSASHFTHNEANCAACQARSLHAAAPGAKRAPIAEQHATGSRPRATVIVLSADLSPQANPRAPPTLI